jgi:hypothetical protein
MRRYGKTIERLRDGEMEGDGGMERWGDERNWRLASIKNLEVRLLAIGISLERTIDLGWWTFW